ncbi:hypothetical protein [Streptomyces sp. NPDC092370]|uniref:hypothetical protein n=1 Tax=Streptomyces sp. NPDC092370 TaxID=3366016 RepID=UPI00380F17A2
MSEISACGIVVPTDWVPLPLEPPDDVKDWAKSTAAELCDRSRAAGCDLDKRMLGKELRTRADDSRSGIPSTRRLLS